MQYYDIPTYDGEGHSLAMPTPTGEWAWREDVEKLERRMLELEESSKTLEQDVRIAYHMFATWQESGREFDGMTVLRRIVEELDLASIGWPGAKEED